MPMRDFPNDPPKHELGKPDHGKKYHATPYGQQEAAWLSKSLVWVDANIQNKRRRETARIVLCHVLQFIETKTHLRTNTPYASVSHRRLAKAAGLSAPTVREIMRDLASSDPEDDTPLVLVWSPPKGRSDLGSYYVLGLGYTPDGKSHADHETIWGRDF